MDNWKYMTLEGQKAYCEQLIKLLREYESKINIPDATMMVLVTELQARLRVKIGEELNRVGKIKDISPERYVEEISRALTNIKHLAGIMEKDRKSVV